MDLKKMGGIVVAFVVLLWIVGRFTARPSPAAPQSAAQQPATDKWHVTEDRSTMDDSKTEVLSLDSDDIIQGPLGPYKPSLVIRCKEGKTDIYVVTGMAASVEEDLDGGPIDTHTVRLRLDQGSAESYGWSESTDHKALFASDAVYGQDDQVVAYSGGTTALAKQLATAQTLAFQFTPFDANPAIARFDLRGLGTHLSKIADACKWDAN